MDDSKCPKQKYCGFEIDRNDENVRIDRCRFCGKKVIYLRKNGKMDDKKYTRDHVRDICQPFGSTRRVYFEVYGEKNLKGYQQQIRDIERSRLTDSDKQNLIKDAKKYLKQDIYG